MKCGADNQDRVREFNLKNRMEPNNSFDLINATMDVNSWDQTFMNSPFELENTLQMVTAQQIQPDGTFSHTDIDINQTTINLDELIECGFNSFDNPTSHIATTVESPQLFNENDPDTQEEQLPLLYNLLSDQQYEIVGLLEPADIDSLLNDVNTDDIPVIDYSSLTDSESQIQLQKITDRSKNRVKKRVVKNTKKLSEDGKKTLPCDVCNKVFKSSTIRRHRYTVHPEYVFYKHYSSTSTKSLTLVECEELATKFFDHVISKCSKIGTRICCCYCDKILCKKLNLRNHLLSQHMDIVADVSDSLQLLSTLKIPPKKERKQRAVPKIKCDECSKVCSTKAELDKHKETHLKMHACKYCSYTNHFPGIVKFHELDKHIVEIVTPHFPSIVCPITFADGVKTYYKKQLNIGTKCPICSGQLADKHAVQRHIVQQHFKQFLKELKEYLGQDQDELSDDESDPEQMEENHSEKFVCKFCTFTTEHSGAIKLHELKAHTVKLVMKQLPRGTSVVECAKKVAEYKEKILELGTQCPVCKGIFLTNAYLQQHMLSHHFDQLMQELEEYFAKPDGGGTGDDVEACQDVAIPPPDNVQEVQVEAGHKLRKFNPLKVV